jgi:UDP-N-acetylmuramoyl-tripeptide--D-alanyl-D-alanine ligase
MNSLFLSRIVEGKHFGIPRTLFGNFKIDSRQIKKGDIFIALKGDKTDGHNFVGEAFKKGAVGAIVEKGKILPKEKEFLTKGGFLIEVENTLEALKKVAQYKREQFKGKEIIAITGSVGKTTTKELLAHLISVKFKVYKTKGNLNSQIGLPLVLANADIDADYWVFELGADKKGNIAYLTDLLKPTFAVLTALGKAHLSGFKNFETLVCTKGEIFCHPSVKKAVLPKKVFNYYRALLSDKEYRTTTGEVKVIKITKEGKTILDYKGRRITVPFPNVGFSKVAEIALKVLALLNIETDNGEIYEAFETFKGAKGRTQPILGDRFLIIDDSYNANPDSTLNALQTLVKVEGYEGRVAILGDMLELGNLEIEEHRKLGKLLERLPVDEVYLYGNLTKFTCEEIESKPCYWSLNKRELQKVLKEKHPKKDTVYLLKGSRGMRMEEFLETLLG